MHGVGVLDTRDVLDLMHGRSRMTIAPRIAAMPACMGQRTGGRLRYGGKALDEDYTAIIVLPRSYPLTLNVRLLLALLVCGYCGRLCPFYGFRCG